MLEPLARRYRVSFIEAIGTDPRHPVTDGWPHLVDQCIRFIEDRFAGEPVFAVGHSLGGYLAYMAAARRPPLFRAIVLLDAPILGPVYGALLAMTKRLGVVDRVTPAGATRDRRSRWESRAAAKAHFRSRRLFRHFAEECLADYVTHGLVADEEGSLRLRIDPDIEYRIYRTFPHRMPGTIATPGGFIGGEQSDVVRRMGVARMQGKLRLARVPGGHLFPLEHPREAAAATAAMLEALLPDA